MTVKSNAFFGVSGQGKRDAVSQVRTVLRHFDLEKFGVKSLHVEVGPDDSIQIVLTMTSAEPDQADADADRATEAIMSLLDASPNRRHLHERQRELVLG